MELNTYTYEYVTYTYIDGRAIDIHIVNQIDPELR